MDPAALDSTIERVNITLPRRVLLRLDAQVRAAGESRSGYIAQLTMEGRGHRQSVIDVAAARRCRVSPRSRDTGPGQPLREKSVLERQQDALDELAHIMEDCNTGNGSGGGRDGTIEQE